jgi:hypothetical protein
MKKLKTLRNKRWAVPRSEVPVTCDEMGGRSSANTYSRSTNTFMQRSAMVAAEQANGRLRAEMTGYSGQSGFTCSAAAANAGFLT